MTRADAIIKRLPKDRLIRGAEIGVYKGSLSRMLLKELPKLDLYMIDRWQAYTIEETNENNKSSMSMRKQETFDRAKEKALKVVDNFRNRAFIIVEDSQKAATYFKNEIFDFVFIDADHSFKAVYNDIIAWLPKIKHGGWICGHDYHRESVSNAIHELFNSVNIEDDEDTTWFKRIS